MTPIDQGGLDRLREGVGGALFLFIYLSIYSFWKALNIAAIVTQSGMGSVMGWGEEDECLKQAK